MKLGIGTYCYMWSIGFPGATPRNPMTAFGLLARARELGVQVVQFGPNLSLESLAKSDLDDLLAQAKKWDIELEVGTRGLNLDHLQRQIDLARRVGSKILRTIPELEGGETPNAEQLAESLRLIHPELGKSRVKLAIENGKIPAAILDRALCLLSSPWIGITLDTANSLAIPEGTEHVVKTLAPHTVCLHIKDFIVKRVWHMMGFVVEGKPAGQGQLNIPWLLEILRAAGASGNAILELWPPEQKSLEETIALEQSWVAASIPYLRQLIPQ
ncbi:MAG: sugar phosphate isomerase/epimerase family protein [Terriglobia bacterium]